MDDMDIEYTYAEAVKAVEDQRVDGFLAPEVVLRLNALLERALVERVNELDEENQDEDTFRDLVTKLQLIAWLAGFLTYAQYSQPTDTDVVLPLDVNAIARLAYGLGQGSVVIRLEAYE